MFHDNDDSEGATIPPKSVLRMGIERAEVPFYVIKFEYKVHRHQAFDKWVSKPLGYTVTGMAATRRPYCLGLEAAEDSDSPLLMKCTLGNRTPSLAKLGQSISVVAHITRLGLPNIHAATPTIQTTAWSYPNCLNMRWGLCVTMLSPLSNFEEAVLV